MSYSSDLKEKLLRQSKGHISELAGFLQSCGSIHLKGRGQFDVSFTTERNAIARHYYKWIQTAYGLKVETELVTDLRKVYRVRIEQANGLLSDLGLLSEEDGLIGLRRDIPMKLVSGELGLRNYITGVFIGSGVLTDPHRGYHLEFVFDHSLMRKSFSDLLSQYDLEPKFRDLGDRPAVYFKSSEAISDFLKIIGANGEAFAFEDLRILKDMKNDIQRKVNYETANITKTVVASQRLVECIELIQREMGLSALPDTLRELAQLRWEEPDLSLKEIGEKLNPPLSKSGVNHRMERLLKICQKLKNQTSKAK